MSRTVDSAARRLLRDGSALPSPHSPPTAPEEFASQSGRVEADSHRDLCDSFSRQIESARERGDRQEENRIRGEFEAYLQAFRARDELTRLVPVRSVLAGETNLSGADREEIRTLLDQLGPRRSGGREGLVLGCALLVVGEDERALEIFDRLASTQRESAELHCARGEALLRLGRAAQADLAFRRVGELEPEEALGFLGRGRACLSLGRHKAAAVALRRALTLERHRPITWLTAGEALARMGREEEALRYVRQGLELKPTHPRGRVLLARTLAKLGREREAVDAYESLVSGRSSPPPAAFPPPPSMQRRDGSDEPTAVPLPTDARPRRLRRRRVARSRSLVARVKRGRLSGFLLLALLGAAAAAILGGYRLGTGGDAAERSATPAAAAREAADRPT